MTLLLALIAVICTTFSTFLAYTYIVNRGTSGHRRHPDNTRRRRGEAAGYHIRNDIDEYIDSLSGD